MLVALGCDMARQCHLDTCPTGIATQREDLRAKFAGTPEQVERFALALAEDLRRELAAVGARDRRRDRRRVPAPARAAPDRRPATLDLARGRRAPAAGRRRPRDAPSPRVGRPRRPPPARRAPLERRLVAALGGQAGFSRRRPRALDRRSVVRRRR